MAEFCEKCHKPMERSDVTHCSENCLFASIENNTSLKYQRSNYV